MATGGALVPLLLAAVLLSVAAAPVSGAEYVLPTAEDDVVGRVSWTRARHDDTLVDIARGANLGFQEMKLANPEVDPWLPSPGGAVRLPGLYVLPAAPREGIVLNLAELRLYHYPPAAADEPRRVVTHPVSAGRRDWQTPLGTTRVVRKAADPAWYPPASIRAEHAADGDPLPRIVPPGPDNPLGRHALYLGISGYLLHGTNRPYGIGMQVTHGCLRLYPEDIAALHESVPVDTPVTIVDQPYKAGWRGDDLYLEAHPGREAAVPNARETEQTGDLTAMVQAVVDATRTRRALVDWEEAEKVAERADGVPARIGFAVEPAAAPAPR